MTEFNDSFFKKYSALIYSETGISINPNKKQLLQMKLNKAMNKINIKSYSEYYDLISKNKQDVDFQKFVNHITTNTTQFFRENNHFEFIENNLNYILENNPRIMREKKIRIWSAGCSTGQEPITLSIILGQCFKNKVDIKILATDIDTKVLKKAISGIYFESDYDSIPKEYNKYFTKVNNGYKVKDEIHRNIKYRHFNLMNNFNFKNGFDMIFCRNVMIYFNNSTQETLINKFYNHIVPGGILFIGHSESLINKNHKFKNLGPSMYLK